MRLFLLLDQGRGGRSTASTDHHLFFVGASGRWWWWWWWWWWSSSLDAVESATLLMSRAVVEPSSLGRL